jgi:hypothetical protein
MRHPGLRFRWTLVHRGQALLLAAAVVLGGSLDAEAQTFTNPLNQVEIDQQVSPAATGAMVFSSPQKSLAAVTVVAGASAGYALVIDATSLPANGAVASCAGPATARPCLMWCAPIAANGYVDKQWNSPMSFQSGVLVAFSTTGCASLTVSATAQIFGQSP